MSNYKFTFALLKFLVVVWVIVFVTVLQLLVIHFSNNFALPFITFIFSLILGTVSGAYLYVILSIPYFMHKEFDIIKNKVALGKYNSVDHFQFEIAEFLIKFFKFPGMTVTGGRFAFKNCEILEISSKVDYSKISSGAETIQTFTDRGNSVVSVPVVMGNKYLGEFHLEVKTIFMGTFRNIIADFENYQLDDLLMIVILLNEKE